MRRTSCQEALLVENSESIYEKQTHVEYTAQEEESHPVVVTHKLETWSRSECGKQRGIPWTSFRRTCLAQRRGHALVCPRECQELFHAELTRPSGCLARQRICFAPAFERRFISIQGIMERLGNSLASQEKPKIVPEAEAAAKKRAAKRKENSLFERVQHHPVLSGKAEKERKRELRKIDTRPHWRKPKGLVRKVRDFVDTLETRLNLLSTCRSSSEQTRSKSLLGS